MFDGWDEYPPVNVIVKAIAMGFGAKFKTSGENATDDDELHIPPSANYAMQSSAAEAISAKAGGRLPMLHGKDVGLPKALPVFDVEELRKRNVELLAKKARATKVQPDV